MPDHCLFCRIISGEVDADVVFDDEHALAFLDHRPLFHGHTLVVPRRHVVTLADLRHEEVEPYFRRVQLLSAEIPRLLGAQGSFVANNNTVSQSVPHLHFHVVPRRKGDGLRGFFWPRTRYASGEAGDLARRLRDSIVLLED